MNLSTEYSQRLLTLCFLFVWSLSWAGDRRPNVILVMADDLGYEALSCHGSTSYETPVLDRIASEGMRFTHCYSQPVCTPSRVKIMTGRSNARNYTAFGVLRPEERTFGNIMKEAGYKTCLAGKWQLSGDGPGSKTHNAGTWMDKCGFDEWCVWAYEHYLKEEDMEHYRSTATVGPKKGTSRFWNPAILENGHYRPTSINDFGPDLYSQFILDFIERNKAEEFFVYYPMVLTHGPFIPTPLTEDLTDEMKFKSSTRHFEAMIQYTGLILQALLDQVEACGIAEETLILFTCDNGSGREHVSWMGDRLVLGGTAMPIDAGCHVPMMATWKGVIEPGSICHDLIDFSDFLPTIAELGKAAIPDDRILDGRSFLPQLKGHRGRPRDSVLVHYDKDPGSLKPKFRRVRFAYDGRYKLYLSGEMYEVSKDWDEQNPIDWINASPELLASRKKLQDALERLPAWNLIIVTFAANSMPQPKLGSRKRRLF